jgi:Na+-driven multidrug efflux pump
MAYVLDGFANATEVLCGKAIGLKNRVMLRQALKLNSYWHLLLLFASVVCITCSVVKSFHYSPASMKSFSLLSNTCHG